MATLADVLNATTVLSGKVQALQSDVTTFIQSEGVLTDLTPAVTAIQSIGTTVDSIDAAVKAATPAPAPTPTA